MIDIFNKIPIDYLCFGNHEDDVPGEALLQRIKQYKGTWLNSNMRDFPRDLPVFHTLDVAAADGALPPRTVAFCGLLLGGEGFNENYKRGAFLGAAASITPVLKAVPGVIAQIKREAPNAHVIIPITHQDLAEDILLAESGKFPFIAAGQRPPLSDPAPLLSHSVYPSLLSRAMYPSILFLTPRGRACLTRIHLSRPRP
jgi:2',3'-cyclic-nucleotide 2'-phosphodiesterase (5'-nucleotidase family)